MTICGQLSLTASTSLVGSLKLFSIFQLFVVQVEESEEVGPRMKTVVPWILLYKLIVYDESKLENQVVTDSIPGKDIALSGLLINTNSSIL